MKIKTQIIHHLTGEYIEIDPIESLMENTGLSREEVAKAILEQGVDWVYEVVFDELLSEEDNRNIAQMYYEAALDELKK